MKAALPLLTFFLLAPLAWGANESDNSARAFALEWVAAYNRNDPALMAGFYAEDPRSHGVVSVGKTFRGYQAIAELYRSDMQVVEFYDSYAKELQVWTEGDTALVSFEPASRWTDRFAPCANADSAATATAGKSSRSTPRPSKTSRAQPASSHPPAASDIRRRWMDCADEWNIPPLMRPRIEPSQRDGSYES
ncbi:YybH family protein [Cerasicoccus maritimus]|uniref:YybH family protein n=1 Tax=Cerasicoccus maritimus TaxID=490089 RepID=UPI00285289FF|nr:nuclear transport factor 2 family protein [Cerasicoccus maritimus]